MNAKDLQVPERVECYRITDSGDSYMLHSHRFWGQFHNIDT